MKNNQRLRYMVAFSFGIALILNYMRFISYYKELSNIDENFTYIYTDSVLSKGIVEECNKYQIDCEIWNIGKEEELCGKGLTHTAVGYVICAENGILKELYLNRGELSCVISSELAYLLFGTENIIGEKIEYRGKLYEVKKLIKNKMPIVFLNEESTQLKGENKDYPDENGVKIIENEDYSKNNKENILESKISLAMVKGIEALSYHEIENLFMDSDFIIDVNLLKWIVYIIIFFCFFCIMGFCFCQNKKWDSKPSSCSACRPAGRMAIHAMEARGFHSKWFYVVVMLIWFLYVRIFIFASIEDFPVWSLPGKWSDLEGWGKLGEEVLKQISYIIHFKDYPIIYTYYQGVIKSIFYLFLSLILVYLFFKSSLRLKYFWAVHIVITIIAFIVYVYCSDKDMKMLIYFVPCFIGSFICKDTCNYLSSWKYSN